MTCDNCGKECGRAFILRISNSNHARLCYQCDNKFTKDYDRLINQYKKGDSRYDVQTSRGSY